MVRRNIKRRTWYKNLREPGGILDETGEWAEAQYPKGCDLCRNVSLLWSFFLAWVAEMSLYPAVFFKKISKAQRGWHTPAQVAGLCNDSQCGD